MIKNFKEFAKYTYDLRNLKSINKNDNFCFLTSNNGIEILKEKELEFLEINNYELTDSNIFFLSKNKEHLSSIKYLTFWNTKIPNLEILKYFKNVKYLNIAHITDKNFNFQGIEYLTNLKTLCLLKTGKLTDISSIKENNSIENLSIIQPTNIKSTLGIKNLKKLKYLNIEGSVDKFYEMNSLIELEELSELKEIEFYKVKIPYNEMLSLKEINPIKLKFDTNLYTAEEYKKLSLILKNVNSVNFQAYINEDYLSFIQPMGKGKRIIMKTDKNFQTKIDKLIKEWKNYR